MKEDPLRAASTNKQICCLAMRRFWAPQLCDHGTLVFDVWQGWKQWTPGFSQRIIDFCFSLQCCQRKEDVVIVPGCSGF